MKPRWHKVLLDLTENWSRTAVVVFSMVVGVFSIGVIAGAYTFISTDLSASYSANHPMNVELSMEGSFNKDLITTVKHMRGVDDAEGRRIFAVRARVPGTTQWTTLNLVAIDKFSQVKINLLRPIVGATSASKNQVLLEKKAFKTLQAQIGSTLEFQLPDETIKTLQVVGVVQDQTTGATSFLPPPFAYVNTDSLATLGQPEGFNEMFVTLAENPNNDEHLRQMAEAIKAKIEDTNITVARTRVFKSNEHPMAAVVRAVLGIFLVMGVLILFLSSSLIANTLSALLSQHLRHIGVMKLVGGRRGQIFAMYIALILAFGFIALLIAVPLGWLGANWMGDLVADVLNFSLLGHRLMPLALTLQIVLGLAVPLLAGFVPVLNGTQITVLNALSGNISNDTVKSSKDKESNIDRFLHRVTIGLAHRGYHLPRPLLISLRNTFRLKSRLIMTLLTLTMGGAIFIAVFNVRTTLFDYIGAVGNYFKADVTATFDRPYRIDEIKRITLQYPGITRVEGWAAANAELLYADDTSAGNLIILAPPADSPLVEPMMVSGRWPEPADERAIAVSENILTEFPNLKPNDYLRMKLNGKKDDWKVVGIFKFISQQGTVAYATYDYVSRYTNQAGRSLSFRIESDQHDEASQNQLAQALDLYFREQGLHVTQTLSGKSTLKRASDSLNILVVILLVMALLTASVGAMGLAGTMGMNVLERTREIGIMRSIGAGDREIMRTVIVEGMTIGAISWGLLAVPITYGLSWIISSAIFNSMIDVHFTWLGFVIWLAVVLVLSALASVLPARSATSLTIREVLAYE
jgi:putative ABC transport system permease protein